MAASVSAREGAALVGAIGALGAGLVGLGIHENRVIAYESAVKAAEFLVVAQGSRQEAEQARDILM